MERTLLCRRFGRGRLRRRLSHRHKDRVADKAAVNREEILVEEAAPVEGKAVIHHLRRLYIMKNRLSKFSVSLME
ncbi:hypothetical protein D3C77_566300 [compost metagenome]